MKKLMSVLALCLAFGLSISAPAPALAQAEASALSDTSLKAMLDGLGMEPKALSNGFLVVIKDGTWTLSIQAVLSPDKTKLGLNANLGEVKSVDAVPAAAWRGVLEAATQYAPTFFYFDKDTHKLYATRVLDNVAMSPAHLRRDITNFASDIKNSNSAWKFVE